MTNAENRRSRCNRNPGKPGRALSGRTGLFVAAAGLALIADSASAAPFLPQEAPDNTSGLLPALVPVMLAAFGVERAIEVIWNYIEWLMLNFRMWQPTNLKSPQYVQFKSGTSLLLGVVMGILLANATGLRILAPLSTLTPGMLGGDVANWDVLLTGIIIGAGAKPTHDLLGILTYFKNFLRGSALRQREAAGAALADGVLKLAQSDAQAMVDIPGIGPARMGASATGDEGGASQPGEEQASMEKYAEMLQRRTVM